MRRFVLTAALLLCAWAGAAPTSLPPSPTRWVTDSDCVATVLNVTVATSVTTFQQLTAALEGAGLTSASRKYMVAWDDGDATGAFCGLGESMPDSSVGSLNKNETQAAGAMFAAVEPNCWTAFVAGHEIMHTLGITSS